MKSTLPKEKANIQSKYVGSVNKCHDFWELNEKEFDI